MGVIDLIDLTKTFGHSTVVDHLDMHIEAGKIYGFVGQNGAGKSTTMKMIASLVRPTSGEISLFNGQKNHNGNRIGAIIENPGLIPDLNGYDNLIAKAIVYGVANPSQRSKEMLKLVGLSGVGRKKSKKYSVGMKQRLGIAMALVTSPDILLLDEPFNGLDPQGVHDIRNLLIKLNQERGITIMVSTHVLDQLGRMATHYGVIYNGRMVREMSAQQVDDECRSLLKVRTLDTPSALVALQNALPNLQATVHEDQSIVITGDFDTQFIAQTLHNSGQTVVEISSQSRDIEEYFIALMNGGNKND